MKDLIEEVIETGNAWIPVRSEISARSVIEGVRERGHNARKGEEKTDNIPGVGIVATAEEVVLEEEQLELFQKGIVKKGKFTFGIHETRYWNADLGCRVVRQTKNWNALTFYHGRGMEVPQDLQESHTW